MNKADLGRALAGLRDIHLPAEPGATAPPFGETTLALVSLAVAAGAALLAYRWWRSEARRTQRRLVRLRTAYLADRDGQRLAVGLAALLRERARARHGEHFAGTSGDEWLRFLDAHGGDGKFAQGSGRLLASAPYQPPQPLDAAQADALCALVGRWLRKNA